MTTILQNDFFIHVLVSSLYSLEAAQIQNFLQTSFSAVNFFNHFS